MPSKYRGCGGSLIGLHSEVTLENLRCPHTCIGIMSDTNMLRRWLNGHAVKPHNILETESKYRQSGCEKIAAAGVRKYFVPFSILLDEAKPGACRYNITP